jgi:hypothetical protein
MALSNGLDQVIARDGSDIWLVLCVVAVLELFGFAVLRGQPLPNPWSTACLNSVSETAFLFAFDDRNIANFSVFPAVMS